MKDVKKVSQYIAIIALSMIFNQSYAQDRIAYYDAITLSKIYKNDTTKGIPVPDTWKILEYYIKNKEKADSIISQNPFLKDYFDTDGSQSLSLEENEVLKKGLSIFGSTVSGLNVTNMATGFSQFLIERANEEVNIIFFNKFRKFLDENQEAATLFPTSTNFITNTEPYQYALLLQTFKEAFREDITNLVNNIEGLLELPRYQQFGQEHPEAYAGLAAASAVSHLANGGNAADVIKKLGEFNLEKIEVEKKNLYSAIKLMSLLSESIRSNVDGEAWVRAGDIINNETTLNIFLGLLYQSGEDIVFRTEENKFKSFQDILKDAKNAGKSCKDIITYLNTLEQKWKQIQSLQTSIKDKKDKGEKVEYTEYYHFFEANINMIETLLDVNTTLTGLGFSMPKTDTIREETKKYLTVLKTGNKIYKNISEKNYSSAVMNFVIVYEEVIGKNLQESIVYKWKDKKEFLTKNNQFQYREKIKSKNLSNQISEENFKTVKSAESFEAHMKKVIEGYKIPHSSKQKDIKEKYNSLERQISEDEFKAIKSVASYNDYKHKIDKKKNFIIPKTNVNEEYNKTAIGISKADFLKYATFMAAMVEAESPEAAKNIIRAAALPAGSSSIKKNSYFNISLQSYAGIYRDSCPATWNFCAATEINNAWNNKFGVIAPLGVSVNWGLGGGSLGFLGSLLDVGAIVDYEFRSDTTRTFSPTDTTTQTNTSINYKIELGQLFSPGFYLVYGMPRNIPLTLGIGAQHGPGLIQINDTGSVVREPALRLNVFLAFDIPLVTILNSPKRNYPRNK
ncbi:MAG: hypothetical protein OEY56_06955 [Cyclobacteriaceae bacterium]|nr:hypothetical protein [Cyclobacteriaceae bacterium]